MEFDFKKASNFWTEKDKITIKMDKDKLLHEMKNFLNSHNTCALATGFEDFVRCTPIEYNFVDDAIWLFSEGGLKFKALANNLNVSIAIFDPYSGFGNIKGMQVTGKAEIIEAFSEDYLRLLKHKNIPIEAIKKMESPMPLIKVSIKRIDYLNSDFKKMGYGSRQYIEF